MCYVFREFPEIGNREYDESPIALTDRLGYVPETYLAKYRDEIAQSDLLECRVWNVNGCFAYKFGLPVWLNSVGDVSRTLRNVRGSSPTRWTSGPPIGSSRPLGSAVACSTNVSATSPSSTGWSCIVVGSSHTGYRAANESSS